MHSKTILTPEIIEKLSNEFRNGTSISDLMLMYGWGRNKITKTLRDNLGDDYTILAKRICARSWIKSAPKRRGTKNPHTPEWNAKISAANKGRKLSEETKRKISEMGKTRFERGTWTREAYVEAMKRAIQTKRERGYFELHSKRHSAWMLKHAPNRGKKVPEETRQKMKDSKLRFYASGGKHSMLGVKYTQEQCQQISARTKQMWADGKFSYSKKSNNWRSKLEILAFELIQQRYPDVQHSVRLTSNKRTFIFDMCIPSLKILIEFNGNYWHLNPRKYAPDYFDKSRKITAQNIWDLDTIKHNAGKEAGFKTLTIWEDEFLTNNEIVLSKIDEITHVHVCG